MFTFSVLQFWSYTFGGCCLILLFAFLQFALLWPSMQMESSGSRRKNVGRIIHSLAFGARGVYFYSIKASRIKTLVSSSMKVQVLGKWYRGLRAFALLISVLLLVMLLDKCDFNVDFDATLGFPGEGTKGSWSDDRITMATWNARSMTKKRFNY